jgi:hypothetical protein
MHHTPKPVRKCHGCKLNLGDHCGIFEEPHEQWHNSTCRGYQNEELYQKYLEDMEKHPQDDRKEARRRRAQLAQTEPHRDGTLSHKSPYVGGP